MTASDGARPGFTIPELAAMFGEPRKKILAITKNVAPAGARGPFTLYPLLKVAIILAKEDLIGEEVVEHVMRLDPADLPVKLRKAFWDGQTSKLRYQRAAGDLWPTERIIELAGDAFKTMRLSLQLMSDGLERETGLTEKQRILLQNRIDATLNDMRERLVDVFHSKRRSGREKVEVALSEDDFSDL